MEKENEKLIVPIKKKKARSWETEKSVIKKIILVIAIILVLAWVDTSTHFSASIKEEMSAKRKWQAVFLNNNQVYLGHLSRFGMNYWKLSDVHYIQTVKVPVQPQPETNPTDKENETTQPLQEETRNTVVKITNDLHSPEGSMFIPASNILFWQNLRGDSEVVRAIITPPAPQQK